MGAFEWVAMILIAYLADRAITVWDRVSIRRYLVAKCEPMPPDETDGGGA